MEKQSEEKIQGLSQREAEKRLKQYGKNRLEEVKRQSILDIVFNILKEPMFILLIVSSLIYFFVSRETVEGTAMLLSVGLMIAIDVVQQYKTDRSLEKLREMSAPKARVIRDGREIEIDSENVVPGDVMIISEGDKICADGEILVYSDLAIDESALTGESDIIYKSDSASQEGRFRRDCVYHGTNVIFGSAQVRVTATGKNTQVGKIGQKILEAPNTTTLLEKQVNGLVKVVSTLAMVVLLVIVGITYFKYNDFYSAIINGITFAISSIPEEFPVILTIFLSLGAYRISTKEALIRRLPSVETLGSVSVMCVDKTGTLTENKMTVEKVICEDEARLKEIAVLACEKNSYDPMEKAILKYGALNTEELFSNRLITEYPFTSELKMMGHVWQINDKVITAVKGSPEGVLKICKLTDSGRKAIEQQQKELSEKGYRVIAVAAREEADESGVKSKIEDCELDFVGLISFIDPPRREVKDSIKICNRAGIKVIMITGDNPVTARAIGDQIGLEKSECVLTGDQIEKMSDKELAEAIARTNIFARVVPEQKLRIIDAIKSSGAVVAMTGDGVNDAPALKYADIGIAMGNRGTNIAKEASDMVLLDDNFTTIVETVKDGRRIYDNISKAIRYVLTFKVPIVLMSLLVPLLGISPMLLPIHIVLLEFILNPISAIVLERQPAERDVMERKPRNVSRRIVQSKDLLRIGLQGLVIFISTFFSYTTIISKTGDINLARSFAWSILILSNIFLIYVNSSDTRSAFGVMKSFAADKTILLIILFVVAVLVSILYWSPLNMIFKTVPLNLLELISVVAIAFVSVIWYEVIKLCFNRNRVR